MRGLARVAGTAVVRHRMVVAVGRWVAGGKALGRGLVALVVGGDIAAEHAAEVGLRLTQRDPVLRALGARDARHDIAEIELSVSE